MIQKTSAKSWPNFRLFTRPQSEPWRVPRSSWKVSWVVRRQPTGSWNTRQKEAKTMKCSLLKQKRTLNEWDTTFHWLVRRVLLLLYSIAMLKALFLQCYSLWFSLATDAGCTHCTPGWILMNSVCYFFYFSNNGGKSWQSARQHCQTHGGDLVVLDSKDKEVESSKFNSYFFATLYTWNS